MAGGLFAPDTLEGSVRGGGGGGELLPDCKKEWL